MFVFLDLKRKKIVIEYPMISGTNLLKFLKKVNLHEMENLKNKVKINCISSLSKCFEIIESKGFLVSKHNPEHVLVDSRGIFYFTNVASLNPLFLNFDDLLLVLIAILSPKFESNFTEFKRICSALSIECNLNIIQTSNLSLNIKGDFTNFKREIGFLCDEKTIYENRFKKNLPLFFHTKYRKNFTFSSIELSLMTNLKKLLKENNIISNSKINKRKDLKLTFLVSSLITFQKGINKNICLRKENHFNKNYVKELKQLFKVKQFGEKFKFFKFNEQKSLICFLRSISKKINYHKNNLNLHLLPLSKIIKNEGSKLFVFKEFKLGLNRTNLFLKNNRKYINSVTFKIKNQKKNFNHKRNNTKNLSSFNKSKVNINQKKQKILPFELMKNKFFDCFAKSTQSKEKKNSFFFQINDLIHKNKQFVSFYKKEKNNYCLNDFPLVIYSNDSYGFNINMSIHLKLTKTLEVNEVKKYPKVTCKRKKSDKRCFFDSYKKKCISQSKSKSKIIIVKSKKEINLTYKESIKKDIKNQQFELTNITENTGRTRSCSSFSIPHQKQIFVPKKNKNITKKLVKKFQEKRLKKLERFKKKNFIHNGEYKNNRNKRLNNLKQNYISEKTFIGLSKIGSNKQNRTFLEIVKLCNKNFRNKNKKMFDNFFFR